MFKWFQSKPQPPKLAAGNNGEAVSLRNPSTKEEIFLADMLADVLKSNGKSVQLRRHWLELEDGFVLQPHIVDLADSSQGVRTATTIDINHQTLFHAGLFEYQHATADTVKESIRKGFEDWAALDWPALLDASKDKPETCTVLVFDPKADQPNWPHRRRAVLGPISFVQQRPTPDSGEEAHPFCPCCMLTNNFRAFEELIRGEGFYGIRLFAGNYSEGPAADCRVNGVDYPTGTEALKEYVKTWPDRGFEFRKQFIVLQPFGDESKSKLSR